MSVTHTTPPAATWANRLRAERAYHQRRFTTGLRIAILTYPHLDENIDLITAIVDDVLAHRRATSTDPFRPGGFWDRYEQRIHDQATRIHTAITAPGYQLDPDHCLTLAWRTHAQRLKLAKRA